MQQINKQEFMRLVNYMQAKCGINLEQHLELVETRIGPILRIRGFQSLGEYLSYVESDKSGEESKILITKLTTNFTYFMREAQHYNYIKNTILPSLKTTLTNKDIRTWSAGCSSGEEAYTMAMVFNEYFGPEKSNWDTVILATDISPAVLQTAKEGIYPSDRLSKLTPEYKQKYFTRVDMNNYRVNDVIRNQIVPQYFNLMDPITFKKKFHIIFCRNVMIYFNNQTNNMLVKRFYDALEDGGHLIVGMSETINLDANPKFKFVQPSIYKK